MKKTITVILIIFVMLVALALLAGRDRGARNGADSGSDTSRSLMRYAHEQSGVSFSYPARYVAEERNTGTPARARTTVTLIAEEDASRTSPEGGEGPTAITFDFFQNNLDMAELSTWVEGTNDSNFKLPPDEPYASTSVAGRDALRYSWDGLYTGESVVFSHNGNIVMVSVSFRSHSDQIRDDFEAVLRTIELSDPEPLTETAALKFVKDMYPELAAYPSNSLPPKTVSSRRGVGAWHFAFLTEGSGVPYVLEAMCYSVTDSREVTKAGTYAHAEGSVGADTIDPATCAAIQ